MDASARDRTAPASAGGPCAGEAGYGLRPAARPGVARFARAVTRIVETCAPDEVPERVAEALAPLLRDGDLLAPEHRRGAEDGYRRHVLYADPQRRFTVMAIVWRPGQRTSIHGHASWGAVGVYEGRPNVCCYDCEDEDAPRETTDQRFEPGALCAVRPGMGDAHRIYNGTDEPVITIHTYGLDLVTDPEAINVVVAD